MHANAHQPETLFIEPVVPVYRVPFFTRLYERLNHKIRISACREIPGQPASARNLPAWAELERSCIRLLGGRLLWQTGLGIPAHFGPGDVIVIDANPRYLSNVPLLLAAKRRGIGIVSWGHGMSPTSRMWRARLRFAYMKLADVIILYTDEEARQLAEFLGSERPILATNNTIDSTVMDEEQAKWPPARLAQFRSEQQLDERCVLLFVGRMRRTPSCGLDAAIAALPQLLKDVPNALLAVVGSGEMEAECKELATQLGVADSVRWLGALREAQAAPWFMASDLFVYPGSIGLALQHAFCYGLPVITHADRRMHNPEIAALREGVNGMTFTPGDVADLASKCATILRDAGLRKRLSDAAFETVRTDYSMKNMVERFATAVNLASLKSLERRKS